MGEPDKVIIKIDKRSKNIYFMKEIDFYNDKDEHKKEERQQKKESQDNFKRIITNYIRSIEAFKKAGLTINNVSPVIISIIIKDTLLPIISRDTKSTELTIGTHEFHITVDEFKEIQEHIDEINMFSRFSTILPKILIIGLVSV